MRIMCAFKLWKIPPLLWAMAIVGLAATHGGGLRVTFDTGRIGSPGNLATATLSPFTALELPDSPTAQFERRISMVVRKQTAPSATRAKQWHPNRKLHRLNRRGAFYRLRNAFEGLAFVASIGAGKSSVLKQCAQGLFEIGAGGICLGPKADFEETMFDVLSKAGAGNRSIVMREGYNGINLLRAEAEIFGSRFGLEENIVDSLWSGVEVVTRMSGQSNDPFWPASAKELNKHLVVVDMIANGGVDVRRLREMMMSLPREHHLDDERSWESRPCLVAIRKVMDRIPRGTEARVDMALDYVLKFFPELAERTATSIIASLNVVLDIYCRDVVYNAICKDSGTWKLSDLREKGTIVVCDYPVKAGYDLTGLVIGACLKRAVGKQIERELKEYPRERRDELRPIVFVIDDCGSFLNRDDLTLFSTSREARLCPLLAFQSLGLLRHQMGRDEAALNDAKTTIGFMLSVLGGQSQDEETCKYFSGQRGERLEKRIGGGQSEGENQRGRNDTRTTENTNYQFVPAPELPYYAYLNLPRGGLLYSGKIGGILTMPDKIKGAERRFLKLDTYQEAPIWTTPAGSLEEWWQRFKWKVNHFRGRNCFVWFDSKPRLRLWNGHVPFRTILAQWTVDSERGKKLLTQWVYFWFFERENAVYMEEEYNAESSEQ